MGRPWRVMLNRGGMRSLVALAMESEPERLAAVYVHEGRVSDEACHAAALSQAEHFETGRVLELSMPHLVEEPAAGVAGATGVAGVSGATGVPGVGESHVAVGQRDPLGSVQLLVGACGLAIRINADRVIWPVQVGEDFDAVARVTETLLLISQIVAIEHGRELAIETPLLEMTDRQLVEIGHQMSVPWEKARTCHAGRGEPCGACEGCQRRNAAFAQAGIEDPLHLAHAHSHGPG